MPADKLYLLICVATSLRWGIFHNHLSFMYPSIQDVFHYLYIIMYIHRTNFLFRVYWLTLTVFFFNLCLVMIVVIPLRISVVLIQTDFFFLSFLTIENHIFFPLANLFDHG